MQRGRDKLPVVLSNQLATPVGIGPKLGKLAASLALARQTDSDERERSELARR